MLAAKKYKTILVTALEDSRDQSGTIWWTGKDLTSFTASAFVEQEESQARRKVKTQKGGEIFQNRRPLKRAQQALFESLDSDKDGKLNFNEINTGTDIGREKVLKQLWNFFCQFWNKSIISPLSWG